MKNINIQSRSTKQITNVIALGSGKRISFTSKREAIAFVGATNRFLTNCLVILNETYIFGNVPGNRFDLLATLAQISSLD